MGMFRNFLFFFDTFSFISLTLVWTFISLQIYKFWIMGISLVDSVYDFIFILTWSPYSKSNDSLYDILGTNLSKSGYVLILRQITDIHLFITPKFSIGIS